MSVSSLQAVHTYSCRLKNSYTMLFRLLLLALISNYMSALLVEKSHSSQNSDAVQSGQPHAKKDLYTLTDNKTFQIQISPRDICGTERFREVRLKNGSVTDTEAAKYYSELASASKEERRTMMLANLQKASQQVNSLVNFGSKLEHGLPKQRRTAPEDTDASGNLIHVGIQDYLAKLGIKWEEYLLNAKIDADYLQRMREALASIPQSNDITSIRLELKRLERFFRSLARHFDLSLGDLDYVWREDLQLPYINNCMLVRNGATSETQPPHSHDPNVVQDGERAPSFFWREILEFEFESQRVPQLPTNRTQERQDRRRYFGVAFSKACLAYINAGIAGGITGLALNSAITGVMIGALGSYTSISNDLINFLRDQPQLTTKEACMLIFFVQNFRDAMAHMTKRLRSSPSRSNDFSGSASRKPTDTGRQQTTGQPIPTLTPSEIEMVVRLPAAESTSQSTRAEACEGSFEDWHTGIDWSEDPNYSGATEDWFLVDDP